MIAVPYCFHEDPYRMINFWIIQVAVRCLLQETPSPCGFPDALYNTANQSSCNYFFFTGWGSSCANSYITALTSDPKWGKTASIFFPWPLFYKWLNALLMVITNAKKAVNVCMKKKRMSKSLDLLCSSILLVLFFNQYVCRPGKLVTLVTSLCPTIFLITVAEAEIWSGLSSISSIREIWVQQFWSWLSTLTVSWDY